MVLERNESAEVRRVMRLLCGLLHHRGGRTKELLCQEFAPRLNEGKLRGLNLKKSAATAPAAVSSQNSIGLSTASAFFGGMAPVVEDNNWVTPEKIQFVFNRVFSNLDTLNAKSKDEKCPNTFLTQQDVNRCLAFLYPDSWRRGCDYVQLLADLQDAHHDFARTRE